MAAQIDRDISIHVPLAGDDPPGVCRICGSSTRFLSTSPLRGTTRARFAPVALAPKFLSTSPLRGTTWSRCARSRSPQISIHVPLAGDDPCTPMHGAARRYFYPRPPCGGRRLPVMDGANKAIFLSTSPLRGTTGSTAYKSGEINIFLSTSPLRGTTRSTSPT